MYAIDVSRGGSAGPRALALALAAALSACGGPPTAEEVVERAARAYRDMQGLLDHVTVRSQAPGEEPRENGYSYGFDSSGLVLLDAGFQTLWASGERIHVTQADVPNKVLEGDYRGDFQDALRQIGGDRLMIPPLPGVVLRQSSDREIHLRALGLDLIEEPQLGGSRRLEAAGEQLLEVEIVGTNGSGRARFAADSALLCSLEIEVRPPWAGGETILLWANYRAELLTGELPHDAIPADAGHRAVVQTFAALQAAGLPLGETVPDVPLARLEGDDVRLSDYRGSIVVIDLWATWCTPCLPSLRALHELAAWADAEGLSLVALPVDVELSRDQDTVEARRHIERFWAAKGFTLETALDVGYGLLTALGSPGLPSTVVLATDGTVAAHHQGVSEDLFEELRGEVLALSQGGAR